MKSNNSINRGICYFIALVFISFLLPLLASCNKNIEADAVQSGVTYEGDEYDQGIVVEEPEEVEPIDEDAYQSEAAGVKILAINWGQENTNTFYAANAINDSCSSYKYRDRYAVSEDGELPGNQGFFVKTSETDSLISITTNNSMIQHSNPMRIRPWVYRVDVSTTNALLFTAKSVKFTFTFSSGKIISKSMKLVSYGLNGAYYGTSKWLVYNTIFAAGRGVAIGTENNITSSYVPQQYDVLLFANGKMGIITNVPVPTAATRTKPAANKFKFAEMNSRCNNRKYTKSFKMTDATQIKSTDGVTFATKYFRN
jgi:hypothetical protein